MNQPLIKAMHVSCTLLTGVLCTCFLPASAQSNLPPTHYKYKITKQVFQRVSDAFGQYQDDLSLHIVAGNANKRQFVKAEYTRTSSGSSIRMDEEVYDLCRTLGRDSLNALAAVVGHELTHHYRKHPWYDTYGLGEASATPVSEKKTLESEADFYGCYAAHLAGYSPDRAFPLILDAIYRKFQLPENLNGYASKTFRKNAYEQKQNELHQLVAVFRAGQFLYATKSFEKAAACFERIARDFPSVEVLNNQAACLLRTHLEQADFKLKKFVFPIEFDVETRLSEGEKSRGSDDLKKAVVLLEESLRLNSSYEPARLNLACAYVFLGNYNAAIGEINKMKTPLPANAHTLRAIAYYHDDQPNKAGSDFAKAYQLKGYKADYNQKMYDELKGQSSWASVLSTDFFDKIPALCAELLEKYTPDAKPQPPINEPDKPGQVLYLGQFEYRSDPANVLIGNVPLFVNQAGTGVYQLAFKTISKTTPGPKMLITMPEYRGQTARGIKVGSSQSYLSRRYGTPTYTMLLTNQDRLWIYELKDHRALIFVLLDKKIRYWALSSRP